MNPMPVAVSFLLNSSSLPVSQYVTEKSMCMQMQQHGRHAHEDSTKIQRHMHLVVFLYAKKVVLELCPKINAGTKLQPGKLCFSKQQQQQPSLLGARPLVPNLQSHSQEERAAEAEDAAGKGTLDEDLEVVIGGASNSAAAFSAFFFSLILSLRFALSFARPSSERPRKMSR